MNPRSPDAPLPASYTPAPRVTALIVNYNAWPDVAALVASLAVAPEVASGRVEVVVVDNASDGSLPDALRRPTPGVRLVLRRENGGFAVGVNAGWRVARSPWLLLINPDVTVSEGWLGRVLARVDALGAEAEAPGVVGFALKNPDGSGQPSVGTFPSLGRAVWEQLIPRSRRKYQAGWRTRAGVVDWVTGACVLVNARMLEELGGLDEEFFLYYEEVALCRSARCRGWRVTYDSDPEVAVVHHRPLQNRAVTPRIRVITRHSKLLYFKKHLPLWQFRALAAAVAAEARLRGTWARWRGRDQEARCWRAVQRVEHDLRKGVPLAGRAVLALADSVTATAGPTARPRPAGRRAERARREA